jgi:hypothetical protein
MHKSLAVLVMGILAAGIAAAQSKGSCDRACLEGVVNQYLTAMVAHDASKAPFAKNLKLTENVAQIPPKEGLWFTSTGLGDFKIYIADPQEGQVAFIGLVKEDTKHALLALRLKVVNRLITEAESLVVRNVNEKNLANNLKTAPPAFSEALAPSERVSRQELIRISNAYFDGIEKADGGIVPWDSECYRIENGMLTATYKSQAVPAVQGQTGFPAPRPCREGLDSGGLNYIGSIRPRRVPVVDEERGVTFGVYVFNHPGFPTIKLKDGSVRPGPFARDPNSMPIAEYFKIKNGKIRDIGAVMVQTPYKLGDGWSK